MKNIFYAFSLIVSFFLLSGSVSAQRQKQALLEGGLVVEVKQVSGRSMPRIPLSDEPSGFWTINLDRQAGIKPVEGPGKVQAVYFVGRLVDGKAELTVSVFRGSRFREFEDIIAKYTLDREQTATVTEVVKYGFEPVSIKAVVVETGMVDVPIVNNRSSSVRVDIFPSLQPMPRFVARFTNNSAKAVIAYTARTDKDKEMHSIPGLLDVQGKAIVEPGKTHEYMVAPDYIGVRQYDLNAVVFADGSYEGDVSEAADLFAAIYGRGDMLAKLVPVLRKAVEAAPKRPDTQALIAAIRNEKSPVATSIVEAFAARFPNDHKYKGADDNRFRYAGSHIKTSIIGALQNLQRAAVGRSDEDVNKAFAAIVGHYEEWLTRVPN